MTEIEISRISHGTSPEEKDGSYSGHTLKK